MAEGFAEVSKEIWNGIGKRLGSASGNADSVIVHDQARFDLFLEPRESGP